MKTIHILKTALGVILLGTVFTACDKFEDDVPPARTTGIILNDDYYNTIKNQGLQIDVLANDSIGGTATLQFGQPQHGAIQTNANGSVFYQPTANYTGPDGFTYTACLGSNCATAAVYIAVKNDPADTTVACTVRAFDDFVTIAGFNTDTTSVHKNDELCGESLSGTVITITQQPLNGQASVNFLNQIHYQGNPNYTGPDELTYTITNAKGQSSAKVRYRIMAPPCQIRARTDSSFINRVLGTIDTVSNKIVTNDIICPNNGPVTVTIQGQNQAQTQYGSFQVSGTGTNTRLIYTTSAGKNFMDYVLYNICQGNNCSTAYMYVQVR